MKSRSSSVIIVIRLQFGRPELESRQEIDFFSLLPRPDRLWGPSNLISNRYLGEGVLTPGIKRPRREADRLPPSIAWVKNAWSYSSTSQYVLTAWCLVKYRDSTYKFHYNL
jgi:hypothetical protein